MTAAEAFPVDGVYLVVWEYADNMYFLNEISRDSSFIFCNCLNHEDADVEWELTHEFNYYSQVAPYICTLLPDYSPDNYPEFQI